MAVPKGPYRVVQNNTGRYHVYGNGQSVRVSDPKQAGFNLYDPNKKTWYKQADDGAQRTLTWQSGRRETRPGSIFTKDPAFGAYYSKAQQLGKLKFDIPIGQLTTNQTRERNAQNSAMRTVAGYYANLGKNSQGFMDQVKALGPQTDQQVQQIGQDRNQQIRAATPQYEGPLGSIAQNLANQEQQSALNRGAATDAATRTFGAQTNSSRQALLGQMASGQQVAGQERLGQLRGLGQQALQPYSDKIAQLQAEKGPALVDTARQLLAEDRTYGLNQMNAQTKAQTAADNAAYKDASLKIAQQNADTSRISATRPRGGGGSGKSPAVSTAFWGDVSKIASIMRGKGSSDAKRTYQAWVQQYGRAKAAAALDIRLYGKIRKGTLSFIQANGVKGNPYGTV